MGLLDVRDLAVEIATPRGIVRPVDGVSFSIEPGQAVALVGESGSGKSMTAASVMQLLPHGGHVVAGSIDFDGRDLRPLSNAQMRRVRGQQIGMIFQDPLSSLNPTMTVGNQVAEAIRLHKKVGRAAALRRARDLFDMVGLPRPESQIGEYPHSFSGGMRQRVMIALALASDPALLIADEPTTALDVTTQAQILDLLDSLRAELKMAVLLITHDLGVVAERVERVMVMYAGRIAEEGSVSDVFERPRHPYTAGLLATIPRSDQDKSVPLTSIPGMPPSLNAPLHGCRFAPRCAAAAPFCTDHDPDLSPDPAHRFACFFPRPASGTVSPATEVAVSARSGADRQDAGHKDVALTIDHVSKEFPVASAVFRTSRTVKAVSNLTFEVYEGETLGLVGESGCGKSTLGRILVALERPTVGRVHATAGPTDGRSGSRGRARKRAERRNIQLIFQDSGSAFDPRRPVIESLMEPLRIQRIGDAATRRARADELLALVRLPEDVANRKPRELSGGQRQRLGIARALALNPRIIVADEPVSALDVSVQAEIINLLKTLQAELRLTLVMISHDLSVVRYLADRVAVMYLGKVVEIGPTEAIYRNPAHPYTRFLLNAIPDPVGAVRQGSDRQTVKGELPSAIDPPSGCRFRTRCPLAGAICAEQEPLPRTAVGGQGVACHFPLQPIAGGDPAVAVAGEALEADG